MAQRNKMGNVGNGVWKVWNFTPYPAGKCGKRGKVVAPICWHANNFNSLKQADCLPFL